MMRRHLLTLALPIALALAPNQAALAQVQTSDVVALRAQGFTALDLKRFEITQVAPSYAAYHAWEQCVRSVAEPTLSQGRGVEETQTIAFGFCAEREQQALSVVARATGVPAGRRTMMLGRAIQARWIAAYAARSKGTVFSEDAVIAGWGIHKLATGSCRAYRAFDDVVSPSTTVLVRKRGDPAKLVFVITGDLAGEAIRRVGSTKSESELTAWSGLHPQSLGKVAFTTASSDGTLILVLSPSSDQFALLLNANSFILPTGPLPNVTLQIGDARKAWQALGSCTEEATSGSTFQEVR